VFTITDSRVPIRLASISGSDQGGTFMCRLVDALKRGPQTENIHPVSTTAKG
jgi:hypothetical protein